MFWYFTLGMFAAILIAIVALVSDGSAKDGSPCRVFLQRYDPKQRHWENVDSMKVKAGSLQRPREYKISIPPETKQGSVRYYRVYSPAQENRVFEYRKPVKITSAKSKTVRVSYTKSAK